MGTIVDKLDYLQETKETIKNSINSKLEIGVGRWPIMPHFASMLKK